MTRSFIGQTATVVEAERVARIRRDWRATRALREAEGRQIEAEALTRTDRSGDPQTQLAVRIPRSLYKAFKVYAVSTDQAMTRLVTEALEDLLVKRTGRRWEP